MELIVPAAMPPTLAPLPVLNASDVLEAPLSSVSPETPLNAPGPSAKPSHASQTVTPIFVVVFLLLAIALLV